MPTFAASRIETAGAQLTGLRDQASMHPLGQARSMLVGRMGIRVQVSLCDGAERGGERWTLEKLDGSLEMRDVEFLLEALGLDEAAVTVTGGIGLAEVVVKRSDAGVAFVVMAS